jgi:hypothetical protein
MARTAFRSLLLTLPLVGGCGPTPPRSAPAPAPAVAASDTSPPSDSDAGDEIGPVAIDPPEPEVAYRPPDRRPAHDDAVLAAAGIHAYESRRLKLYTDIDPDVAKTLPPLADQLYEALVDYFGPLPLDPQGAEFQMTGYLIRDEVPFREQGLMDELPLLLHGKHHANRFWLRDQQQAYYRRHLLLHECTHCFMTFVPGPAPPVWYLEGMAELFGTHRVDSDGRGEFRILPAAADVVDGWGRIAAIRRDCAEGRSLTLDGVLELSAEAFFRPEAYAWSWGLCRFLDSHPRYRERFRKLREHLHDGEFAVRFREAFGPDARELSAEWTLFTHQLQPGYDTTRAAIDFQPGRPLEAGETRRVTVEAGRGWQDAGVRVEAGETIELTAEGQFTLGDVPKPWVSEPQGISYRYFDGIPLGRLVACLDADATADASAAAETHLLRVRTIGKGSRWTVPAGGRVLLRLNEAWDALSDNRGSVAVTLRRISASGR